MRNVLTGCEAKSAQFKTGLKGKNVADGMDNTCSARADGKPRKRDRNLASAITSNTGTEEKLDIGKAAKPKKVFWAKNGWNAIWSDTTS